MDSNKVFFERLRSERARFFLCDFHVHSPASRDLLEGERFAALSDFERTRLESAKSCSSSLAEYEADLLAKNLFPVEEYLAQLVSRRNALLDAFQQPDGDNWGIVAITDHNVCSYACRLSDHAWNTRNDCRLIVLPGIELEIDFPVPTTNGRTSAHILLIFAPTTNDRNIYSAIREISGAEWDFGKKLEVSSLPEFIRRIRDHEFPALTIAAHVDTGKGLQARTVSAIRDSFQTPEAEFARLTGELDGLLQGKGAKAIRTWEMTEVEENIEGVKKEINPDTSVPLQVLELIGQCGFDGLQVQQETSGRHYRRLHRFERHIGRAVPVVCSDAHRVEDIFACKNGEIPFIKLSSLSVNRTVADLFDEIRNRGIRFGETRFAQHSPGAVTCWISGIEISPDSAKAKNFWPFPGKSPKSFVLALSRNLNCLIGGRGSGKSAAIEAISFATQADFLQDRDRGPFQDDFRRRAEATLSGCNVRLCWTCLDQQGKYLPKRAIFATRYFNESGRHQPISYSDCNSKEIPAANLPIELFRLREVEDLVEKPERLRDLFDDLCGDEIVQMTTKINALVETLQAQKRKLVETAREICRLTRERSPLRAYVYRRQQYDAVNSQDVRSKYERLDQAASASEQAKTANETWTSMCDDFNITAQKEQIEEFFSDLETNIFDEQGIVRPFLPPLAKLVERPQDLGEAGKSPKDRVIEAAVQLEVELSAVTTTTTAAGEMTLAAAKAEREKLAKEGLPTGGKEREAKKQEFDEAVSALESYKKQMAQWDQEMVVRLGTFRELESLCKARTEARKTRALDITARLRQELDPAILVIEIDARPMADRRVFVNWINGHLYPPNTRSKDARTEAIVKDGMMPEQLRSILLGKEQFAPVERETVADGQINEEVAKGFVEHCWGMRKLPSEKQQADVTPEQWATLPVEVREGLVCFPTQPDSDGKLDEKRLGAVLELDEIVFDDLPEIRLMDRPKEMTAPRPLQELSPGQRCSAILPILLLNGTCPLIIDQPEDNLDNRLIREVVVKILASIKLKRQVIIATHNPNLPVLGDAEQAVILRAIEDNKCQLQATGNLDDPSVVRLVTEIMEGGREAFQYRHSIYQPYWEGPVAVEDRP